MDKLSESEIKAGLDSATEWSEVGGEIQRTFQFEDFLGSMAFVQKIADYAERVQHHPDILIRYNKVTLTVSTHDAGGITKLDFDLAKVADGFASS
ncbi:MAG: 4a-hydroxytetrahydrobiopterin dehydratase [Planctomycetota bacterium]